MSDLRILSIAAEREWRFVSKAVIRYCNKSGCLKTVKKERNHRIGELPQFVQTPQKRNYGSLNIKF